MSVLSGFRHSPTLEQIIYSQFRQGLIDYEPPFELNENNIDNEQMSDDLKDLDKEDDAERKTEQTPEGIENTNPDTQNNEQTQNGYDSSYSDNGQYNTSTQAPSGSGQTQKTDDSQQTQGGDNETGDGGTQLNPDDTVKTYKQVVDAYGNPVDVPENVGSVATTGSAAVMVTILGGGSKSGCSVISFLAVYSSISVKLISPYSFSSP